MVLARAFARSPKLVLLVEPFSALDAALRVETSAAVVAAVVAAGATGMLVTHDQSEALSLGDGVAVLRNGYLAQVTDPATLCRRTPIWHASSAMQYYCRVSPRMAM